MIEEVQFGGEILAEARSKAGDPNLGAREILLQLEGCLKNGAALAAHEGPAGREAAAFARRLVALLCRSQPSMAPMLNFASALYEAAFAGQDDGQCSLPKMFDRGIQLLGAIRSQEEALVGHALRLLEGSRAVFTYSRSSTILAVLKHAALQGAKFRVIVSESRPLCEGRGVAAELARHGISVTLVTEAGALSMLRVADLALFGADAMCSDGFVNKIGTSMLAITCRSLELPAYVVADTFKAIGLTAADLGLEAERDAGEIWADAPSGVSVRNRTFETTPFSMLAGIVTEEGERRPAEVEALTRKRSFDRRLFELDHAA